MLLTLLYHRIAQGKYANSLDMMKSHFEHLAKNYSVVLPGEPLRFMEVQVCLTFDDAFFDFFHYVYPLLREFKLRAILAVPTKYILERTSLDPSIRLEPDYRQAQNKYLTHAPFCTWQELQEMSDSGFVQVASHSHSHEQMTKNGLDLEKEIVGSKKILESKLQKSVSTFVYPYGKFDLNIHQKVLKEYQYAMRIGSAVNSSWSTLLYRVPADQLISPKDPFRWKSYVKYWLNGALHKARGR